MGHDVVHEVNELDDGFSGPRHEVLDHVRGAQVQALPILLDPGLVLPTLNGVLIQSHCRRDACRDITVLALAAISSNVERLLCTSRLARFPEFAFCQLW